MNDITDLIGRLDSKDGRELGIAVARLREIIDETVASGSKIEIGVLRSIAEKISANRPSWGGPSNLGDNAKLLENSCEEMIVKSMSIDELLNQLEHRENIRAARAFAVVKTKAEETKDRTVLRKILDKLEGARISTSTFNCLTEENIERVKQTCREKLASPDEKKWRPKRVGQNLRRLIK